MLYGLAGFRSLYLIAWHSDDLQKKKESSRPLQPKEIGTCLDIQRSRSDKVLTIINLCKVVNISGL